MDLNQLLSYIEQPIVFYTVVLSIIWVLLMAFPRKEYFKLNMLEKIFTKKVLVIALLLYITLIFMLIFLNEVTLFPIVHAVMFGIVMLAILSLNQNKSVSAIYSLLVMIIALAPILIMIATKHPYPLGDDARFPGFALAINQEGRWTPYVYAENSYYQFFHLIPFMEYLLASITGIGLSNVAGYYLILKICMYLSYILLAYLFTKEITKSSIASLSAIMLLSITPPLAMSQVVHQGYAIILFLCTSFLLLKSLNERSSINYTIVIFPLLITGVVAHATFTLMLMAFAIPLMVTSNNLASKRGLGRFLLLLTIVSLSYWIYIYVFDILVRPTADAIDKLIDLFTGRALPFQGTNLPWYSGETQNFFVAWALIPSIVISFILLSIPKIISTKKKPNFNFVALLGSLGLIGTGLNYILRLLPTFGGRYFYWLYLLMLPLAVMALLKISNKNVANFILMTALVASISFYGIQDPTLSANTFGSKIGWADASSWTEAKSLLNIIPFNNSNMNIWIDPRLSAPLSGMTLPPLSSEVNPNQISMHSSFAIIGLDNVGFTAMTKDPRNINFFITNFGIPAKEIANETAIFNIVYSSGIYEGIFNIK